MEPSGGHTGWRGRLFASPLTRRILAVNMVPVVVLVAGLLYLDEYRATLLEQELDGLHTQAQMFAAALGEGAVLTQPPDPRTDPFEEHFLHLDIARNMVRRLAEPAGLRARLFSPGGTLLADNRMLSGLSGLVEVEDLPPPVARGAFKERTFRVFDRLFGLLPIDKDMPLYEERHPQEARDYAEVLSALIGDDAQMVRANPGGGILLSVGVPVQHYKQVVGALMLSKEGWELENSLFEVRLTILEMATAALAMTVLLSLYLSGTIARPIHILARAAETVRQGHGRRPAIPRFPGRQDEVADLAHALAEMTEALWSRMDAIESFAADVAHEIKNPLTSLKSAVETAARIADPERQRRLMAIILDDVARLDRLISDISDASRLDAELSRAVAKPVELAALLEALAQLHNDTAAEGAPRLVLEKPENDPLTVAAIADRLAQVFRNLIANAVSFSPPSGQLRLAANRQDGRIVVRVEDEGPGIPRGKEEAIFERFYSERPQGEKFGTHSGLGLSISRQIVASFGGTLVGANRSDAQGETIGAVFTVTLPAAIPG
ncbi:MAG: stimulus-sensing domain-containing protein [Rhodospirillales bacterium]|nr:stimulus-sensing domain-containing protein [Rhodospirillales bacterium]